jgi:4-phospho-D-threonate 3-dehydrogenase / 4-phospho-D-erythronate 3-dehydrogenase
MSQSINHPKLPRIALTMGDPAGVGPELCLRALAEPSLRGRCIPVIIGDAGVLEACGQKLGLPVPEKRVTVADVATLQEPAVASVGVISMNDFTPGQINAATGHAAFTYVNQAIDLALSGAVNAISTAPLNKEAMHRAGHHFPGHTEILATRTAAEHSCMMQYAEEITCTFVTVHVGYHEVPALITTERILEVIELTAAGLKKIRHRPPKMVICGLNPHAGEHGLFGDREEERFIIPAIEEARRRGHDVEGPVPPDTAFLPWKRKTTDAFVCMYHDQGHIPVKALAFDQAVNTTLGLPIIRTSCDHGTALDIAWQGVAAPDSLFAAIRLAATLAE